MGDPLVGVEQHGRVRLLTLCRPEARNAFDAALYRATADAVDAACADDDVHAIVVTGEPPAFSAGQDLGELAELAARTTPTGRDGGTRSGGDTSGFTTMLDALLACDKPLLAAVNGAAVGIGMTMLLHCDLVLVADDARMRVPFAPLGVAPEAASSLLLPARLGAQLGARLLLTGDWLSAEEAVAGGLALESVPRDEVVEATLALAARVAEAPLPVLRVIVSTVRAASADAIDAARRREGVAFRELLRDWRPSAPARGSLVSRGPRRPGAG